MTGVLKRLNIFMTKPLENTGNLTSVISNTNITHSKCMGAKSSAKEDPCAPSCPKTDTCPPPCSPCGGEGGEKPQIRTEKQVKDRLPEPQCSTSGSSDGKEDPSPKIDASPPPSSSCGGGGKAKTQTIKQGKDRLPGPQCSTSVSSSGGGKEKIVDLLPKPVCSKGSSEAESENKKNGGGFCIIL